MNSKVGYLLTINQKSLKDLKGDSENVATEEHESPVRKLVAEASGSPYCALKDRTEASIYDDSVMIMEGDWGGQIYLVCPVHLMKCDDVALKLLLRTLDGLAWPGNCLEGACIYYERHNKGEIISGGMRGGLVEDGLWVHNEFLDLRDKIEQVILGKACELQPADYGLLSGQGDPLSFLQDMNKKDQNRQQQYRFH